MKIYLILLVLFFASQSGLAQVVEPVITVRVTDGKLAISGTVWNQSFKKAVIQRIELAYGNEAQIDLTINPQVIRYEEDWLYKLDTVLHKTKTWKNGVAIYKSKGNEPSNSLPKNILEYEILLTDGKTKIKLSDYGEKPILLVFAEFWSEPCMKQLKVIKDFRTDNPRVDIEIIAVSSEDRPEELERYRQFWKKEKYGYKLGWTEIGLVTYFMDLNGFRAIPQASFIRNGKILFSNTGYYPAGTDSFLSDIIKEINK